MEFPLVSALFITYKRVDHLQRAVESFRRKTDYPRIEVVIADDGSGPEIQEKIRSIPADQYALSLKRPRAGREQQAGCVSAMARYVLMIQDDWVCHGPADYLQNAVMVMEANLEVGIINFAGAKNRPDLSMPAAGQQ